MAGDQNVTGNDTIEHFLGGMTSRKCPGGYDTQDGKTVITMKTKVNTFEAPLLLDKSGKIIEPIGGGGGGTSLWSGANSNLARSERPR